VGSATAYTMISLLQEDLISVVPQSILDEELVAIASPEELLEPTLIK